MISNKIEKKFEIIFKIYQGHRAIFFHKFLKNTPTDFFLFFQLFSKFNVYKCNQDLFHIKVSENPAQVPKGDGTYCSKLRLIMV